MSTLVAYFSRAGQNYGNGGVINLRKGNTEVLAEAIAADLGADLFKIDTVEPYPEDYYATTDQAKRELRENARPAIQGPLPNMEGVDCIVLGYGLPQLVGHRAHGRQDLPRLMRSYGRYHRPSLHQ